MKINEKRTQNENGYNFFNFICIFIYFPLFPFFMFRLFSSHFHLFSNLFIFWGRKSAWIRSVFMEVKT